MGNVSNKILKKILGQEKETRVPWARILYNARYVGGRGGWLHLFYPEAKKFVIALSTAYGAKRLNYFNRLYSTSPVDRPDQL